MDKIEENEYDEVEEKLQSSIDSIEVKPFNEMMHTIRPQLRNNKPRRTFSMPLRRVVATAASVILILAVGFTVYFASTSKESEYLYGDDNINLSQTERSAVENAPELAILNLDILLNDYYEVAIHNESFETVYYTIKAFSAGDNGLIYFVLTVICQPKYSMLKESDFTSGDKETILGFEMSIAKVNESDPPFNKYNIGFTIDNVRYYFEYQTMSEECDIENFMQQFLKQ